jgi:hypothetical protein
VKAFHIWLKKSIFSSHDPMGQVELLLSLVYFKIAGYVDLAVLIIFTPVQFLTLLTVFELYYYPKPAILPYVLFLVTVFIEL